MLSYKYYFNTITRTVSKHTATVLSCYRINITLKLSHQTSVKPSYSPVMLSFKYYFNTLTLTVNKTTVKIPLFYYINISLTQSEFASVNTKLQSCHLII